MADTDEFAESPLWTPPPERVAASAMERFRRVAIERTGRAIPDSVGLHRWSVEEPEEFWRTLLAFALPSLDGGERVMVPGEGLGAARWFPDVRLNVAELILAGAPATTDDDPLLVSVDERDGRRTTTRGDARSQVAAVASALRSEGVGPGDRVVAWMPNIDTTVILMLATASIGAVFSSTSPDFGVDGVLDRFAQIEPTVMVASEGYTYGGRPHDRR